jgi:hypothetical protein
MYIFRMISLALIVSIVTAAQAADDEPKANPNAGTNLVGTWKLVSAKYGGEESTLPETRTTLKHITPTHYMWLTHDKDGKVTRGAGGSYTLREDQFVQQGQYGIGSEFSLVRGKNIYKCRVEGNKWHHTGKLANGLTIEEVWERIEK